MRPLYNVTTINAYRELSHGLVLRASWVSYIYTTYLLIPAVFGWEAGHILGRSPIFYTRGQFEVGR